ncbi:MAG: cysteine hydrolase [Hyphomicrobiaceae bacterium]
MPSPQTLLQLAGANLLPAKIEDACLVFIDLQNEYVEGPIAVTGSKDAIAEAARLLDVARDCRSPIVHVAHKGVTGGLFDRTAHCGQFVGPLTPSVGEVSIEKRLPNAFAGTELDEILRATGRTELIVCGFMTHMCVSSTARGALDLGYRVTVAAPACATRDLPSGYGGTLAAGLVHEVALAELADRFAIIALETSMLH